MAGRRAAPGAPRPGGADVAAGLCDGVLTADFFRGHWERLPLHYRAAERGTKANRLPEALSADDVMALVKRSGSSLKMFRRGDAYDVDDFMVGYLDGASLIVNQADRCNETLFALCRSLASKHFEHVFSVVYLTPPGSQAVRLHNDDQDVFLLQVWGRKRWTIRNAPKLLPYTEEMLGKESLVPPELIGEPTMEFTMEPHDILYIPRGFLHEAHTCDEPSLHITVTVPTSDFCWGVQIVKHLMSSARNGENAQNGLLRKALCGDMAPDDSALDTGLQDLIAEWLKGLRSDSVLETFRERMARTNDGQQKQFAQVNELPTGPPGVTEECRVRLMPGITCHCEEGDEFADFSREVDGQHLGMRVPKSAVPLIRALTCRPQFVADLPGADVFEKICVLQLLHKQGVVQLFLNPDA